MRSSLRRPAPFLLDRSGSDHTLVNRQSRTVWFSFVLYFPRVWEGFSPQMISWVFVERLTERGVVAGWVPDFWTNFWMRLDPCFAGVHSRRWSDGRRRPLAAPPVVGVIRGGFDHVVGEPHLLPRRPLGRIPGFWRTTYNAEVIAGEARRNETKRWLWRIK